MQTVPCPVNQKAAATRSTYRPRRPRRSPLYQLLEDHFENFLLGYDERLQQQYGPLRSDIKKTIYKFLDCGILEHGFARVTCPQCKSEFLTAFSCKSWVCPSCHAKKLTIWSNWLQETLLSNVPHRMITLTVPKRIRPFFLYDRKLLGLLARCASETIKQFYRLILNEPDGVPGIITSIQTFGNRAANYHPHIHCLCSDGLYLPNGSFRSTPFLPTIDMAELFQRKVLKAFVNEDLISDDIAQNMLSWPHSGFNVHIGPRLHPDDKDTLQATAQYAARAPIALSRLQYDRERQKVTYTYTSPYDHQERTERLEPRELIARLATHIPNHYERLIRYSGVYANRSQKARRAKAPSVEVETITETPIPSRWKQQWQYLLKRIFDVTLTCPTCGTEMKVLSVITQNEPIHKILTHLKSNKIDPRAGPFADKAA